MVLRLKEIIIEARKKYLPTQEEIRDKQSQQVIENYRAAKRNLESRELTARQLKSSRPDDPKVQQLADMIIQDCQSRQQMLDMMRAQEPRIRKSEDFLQAINGYAIVKSFVADNQKTDNFTTDPGLRSMFRDLSALYNKNRKIVISSAVAIVLSVGIASKKIGDAYQSALERSAPVQVVKRLENNLSQLQGNYETLSEKTKKLEETNISLIRENRVYKETIETKITDEAKDRKKADSENYDRATQLAKEVNQALDSRSQFTIAYINRLQDIQENNLTEVIIKEIENRTSPIKTQLESIDNLLGSQSKMIYQVVDQISGLKTTIETQDKYLKTSTRKQADLEETIKTLNKKYDLVNSQQQQTEKMLKEYMDNHKHEMPKAENIIDAPKKFFFR